MEILPHLLFAACGIGVGVAARLAFIRMPDSWLLDYDEIKTPDGFASVRAFPFFMQGILFISFIALLYARIPDAVAGGWHTAFAMISIPVLLLILIADWKTRIIPDQLTLFLIVPGLIRCIAVFLDGEPMLAAIGYPLIAAVIAGGSLFLVGLIGQFLMHREAMGMGDVKMITAAAFLIGLGDLLLLILISFFSASLIAIPLLIKRLIHERRVRKANVVVEHELVANESESESDSSIAFGPFIAIASLLLILFHQQIDQLVNMYWLLFLW